MQRIGAEETRSSIAILLEQTQYWTTYEKNHQMISFSGTYRLNRIIWMVLSLGLLMLAYHFTAFKIKDTKRKKVIEVEPVKTNFSFRRKVEVISSGIHFYLRVLRSFFRLDRNYLLKSVPFLVVNLIWIIIVVSEIYNRLQASGCGTSNV